MKDHKQMNPEDTHKPFKQVKRERPNYPDKQSPTTDPKLNPEPAKKLNERLAAENVHGHTPIHGQSVNPGLTVALIGERRILVTDGHLGAPMKGELKGEG